MHKKTDFKEQKINPSVIYLSVASVATMANRSRSSVLKDVTKKHLPAVWGTIYKAKDGKPTKAWLIYPEDAAKYVEKTKNKPVSWK